MKRFNVRYAETFLWDMIDITLYLLDKTESVISFVNGPPRMLRIKEINVQKDSFLFRVKSLPGSRQ